MTRKMPRLSDEWNADDDNTSDLDALGLFIPVHSIVNPSAHDVHDALAELHDRDNRGRSRSTVYGYGQPNYKRFLDYRTPEERRIRETEIERRIGHPSFALLRDAFGALHTEVRTSDTRKKSAAKRVRSELKHTIAMAKRLDEALAKAVA